MAVNNEIIEKIVRNYFNSHNFGAKKEVTTNARLIKIALEAAFEAGESKEPDSLVIAQAIAMSTDKYGKIVK